MENRRRLLPRGCAAFLAAAACAMFFASCGGGEGGDQRVSTISFNINGGVGNYPPPIQAEVGTPVRLPSSEGNMFVYGFFRDGYRFVGWNSSRDGRGNTRSGGYWIPMPVQSITMYAQWERMP